jgi:hypothetical protein
MNTEPAMATAGEAVPDVETAADEAIALCGGDARAAVRALLVLNSDLEYELALTRPVVSYGFSRGWHHRRRQ